MPAPCAREEAVREPRRNLGRILSEVPRIEQGASQPPHPLPGEFGPDYFELAQLTRVTPEQYRAIAPSVREKSIHVHGETIALIPENTDRIAAALAELRQAQSTAPEASVGEEMVAFERRFARAIADFAEFSRSPMSLSQRSQTNAVLSKAVLDLKRLGLERGMADL